MKYTNGKKADTTAFPFKVEASPAKFLGIGKAIGGAASRIGDNFKSGGGIGGLLGGGGILSNLFKNSRGGKRGRVERKNEMRARSGQGGGANEAVNARVEEKIEEKADAIVNQESGEGLV